MMNYIPDRTCPRKPLKQNNTEQKEFEWAQVQGVPCKLIKEDGDTLTLHSFTSDVGQNFRITKNEFQEQFTKAEMDGDIIQTPAYPGGLHVSEFEKRKEANELIAKVLKHIEDETLRNKLKQTAVSQGCTHTAGITDYLKVKSGEKILGPLENFGDAIFNRTKRHAPPIPSEYTHDEFKQTKGFPAPIGIRTKDFCLPSEMIKGVTELLIQMSRFENTEPKFQDFVKSIGIEIPDGTHCCKWCGKSVDANKCASKYKSATNYIELCHRDPNGMFSAENVYWGHGDCNRRQGGYTEHDRIDDVVGLAAQDPVFRAELLRKLGL
jgi:hypothetical protein